MNAAFATPLVTRARGGAGGGGAALTEAGAAVLDAYQAIVARTLQDNEGILTGIAARLKDMSGGK
jgi:molybdate transport system regulatory protein